MIDIRVSGLVKSFDLEKKILDGVSFQVDAGERVGLLGKNGAGKTTLFRILTGELDYDSGEVQIASGRRLGLISQIPVYPAGFTVEDVLRSAFGRMAALKEEMDALTARMAAGESDERILRRYGDLTARFEGLGGWDTDCNGATVGSILGAKLGASAIPAHWTEPLHDTLYSAIPGFHPIAIRECARRSKALSDRYLLTGKGE